MGEKKMSFLIDKNELMKRLGVSVRALEGYMKKGGLPYYKIGRSVRFKESEVDQWIRERKIVND